MCPSSNFLLSLSSRTTYHSHARLLTGFQRVKVLKWCGSSLNCRALSPFSPDPLKKWCGSSLNCRALSPFSPDPLSQSVYNLLSCGHSAILIVYAKQFNRLIVEFRHTGRADAPVPGNLCALSILLSCTDPNVVIL